jgi:hypothetical protein
MLKYLVILAVGVAMGYGYGWKDAQANTKHVAERVLDRIGGETRERIGNDVDRRFQAADSQ